MQKITQKFIENTSIDINEDVIKVFEFIASPDSVQKMIMSTDNGKPALAGIVHISTHAPSRGATSNSNNNDSRFPA